MTPPPESSLFPYTTLFRSLVHRVRDDDPAPLLSAAALAVGLRQPNDRPALRRALALGLRTLPAERPRDVLARALLLDGRSRSFGLCSGGLGLFGRLRRLGLGL